MQQSGDEENARMVRNQLASLQAYSKAFKHVSMQVTASDKGLVMDQLMEMK
jgi:hypothetical protein